MRVYHLSYDTKNCDKDFGEYINAQKYILCVLKNVGVKKLNSPCRSTLIFQYEGSNSKLEKHLELNLKQYFYYFFSIIASNILTGKSLTYGQRNTELNGTTTTLFSNINCDDISKLILSIEKSK